MIKCGTKPIQDTVKGERERMVYSFHSSGPNLLWLLKQDITEQECCFGTTYKSLSLVESIMKKKTHLERVKVKINHSSCADF